jgi:hypothetical protein
MKNLPRERTLTQLIIPCEVDYDTIKYVTPLCFEWFRLDNLRFFPRNFLLEYGNNALRCANQLRPV